MPIPDRVKEITSTTEGKSRTGTTASSDLTACAVEAVLSKKAEDIVLMNLSGVTGIADYFLLCTGNSDVQIKAIANAVRDEIKDRFGERPWHVEGFDNLQWVLLDYVDLVVHVMTEERRTYYGLERLWGDAETESIAGDSTVNDVRMLADVGTTENKPAPQSTSEIDE